MQLIPLQAIPNQSLSVTLANQACQIHIYQTEFGVFLDLYVNNALIIGGVICLHLNRLVRDPYLGFVGDLAIYDTQGTSDPYYTGLGARWRLGYFAPSEIPRWGP